MSDEHVTESKSSRRRRIVAFVAVSMLLVGAWALVVSWPQISFWIRFREDFESLGRNAQGLEEYLHRSSGIRMVFLPAGSFVRGSPASESGSYFDEQPQRRVRVSSFLIAKYEVSQAEWRATAGDKFFFRASDEDPAKGLSWTEAVEFCEAAGLALPREAEWEYACRCGTSTPYHVGSSLQPAQSRFGGGTGFDPTESGTPNAFGLHNMHGNVDEWCQDSYVEDFYAQCADGETDPVCSARVDARVARGGSIYAQMEDCRSAKRNSLPFATASESTGLRPVFRLR
ncbi:MAG: formylglycine-generating enzyme family protein [Planctomycetota bacterium]